MYRCGTKLIAKSQHRTIITPTKSHPVRDEPVSIEKYMVKKTIPQDTFGYIGYDSQLQNSKAKH